MPRLSTPETATPDAALDVASVAAAGRAAGDAASDDDAPVAGASAVVEAATAEAAIAEVHQRFGPGATIVEARRVLRGGIGGFFAKQHVQLHVAADVTDRAPSASVTVPAARDAGAGGVPSARDTGSRGLPADRGDIAARAVALAAELTQGSGAAGAASRAPGGQEGDAHLPGVGGSRAGADRDADAGPSSPVDRLLGRVDAEEVEAPQDVPIVDDTVDFGTFLRAQLAHQGSESTARAGAGTAGEVEEGTGNAEVAPGNAEEASAAPAARAAPAGGVVAEDATTSTEQRDVQPMRWPGSYDPWSIYGVSATPVPATVVDDEAASLAPAAGDVPTAATPSPREAVAAASATAPAVQRADATGVAGPAPTQVPVGAEVTPVATPTDGPCWSTTRLLHLGLPASLVHHLDVVDPTDDLSWVAALTDALRPVCRPLPSGPSVLVGRDAPAVAEVVDLPVARSRTWLDALGAHRWRHLVIGGRGWRSELTDEPLAVSWVRAEDLPDALRCATELGLVLGYGPHGGRLRRARPLDVALAVRELVEAR